MLNENDRNTTRLLLGTPVLGNTSYQEDDTSRSKATKKSFNLSNVRKDQKGRILAARGSDPIVYEGDSHLMTIAPTGAGKGRSVIIPNLLTYEGPVVVIDPKGENFAVTARTRKEMGHEVVRLDPFEVVATNSHGFNPLEIFNLEGIDIETEAQMLAEMLSTGNRSARDPFWDLSSCGLFSGLIAHVVTANSYDERHLNAVRKLLMSDDTVYGLQVLLDTVGARMNRMAYDEIAAFLQMPVEGTRPSVLATANSYMKAFLSERVGQTLMRSSFLLADVVAGKQLSIYIIIPPDKLQSHRALLRMWIGVLLKAITSRKRIPEMRTLFFLDECGQLGNFPYLESVITLCRGYGLQAWSFWQDLSQIKRLYEIGWETMVNNCDVLQIFGAKNFMVASEFAEIVGVEPDEIKDIGGDEQVLVMKGEDAVRARKFDYLKNSRFAGKFDPNPLYSLANTRY